MAGRRHQHDSIFSIPRCRRPNNALRLAMNLVKGPDARVQVFLMGDGVNCAVAGQKTPNGCCNAERMLQSIARQGEVGT